jgi:hypothetical protein
MLASRARLDACRTAVARAQAAGNTVTRTMKRKLSKAAELVNRSTRPHINKKMEQKITKSLQKLKLKETPRLTKTQRRKIHKARKQLARQAQAL